MIAEVKLKALTQEETRKLKRSQRWGQRFMFGRANTWGEAFLWKTLPTNNLSQKYHDL